MLNRLPKSILGCLLAAAFAAGSLAVRTAQDVTAYAAEFGAQSYKIASYRGESAFSLYLGEDGTLYASGTNALGQLGNGKKEISRTNPVVVTESVTAMTTGKSGYALALKTDGSLWGWGSNAYGQLGLGTGYNADETTNSVLIPEEIPLGEIKISALEAGDRHTYALSEDGVVYACGHAYNGALGLEGQEKSTRTSVVGRFTAIDSSYFGGERVVSVHSCENTGFAVTESGKLYGWGLNESGLLCIGDENGTPSNVEDPVFLPKRVDVNGQSVVEFSCRSTTAMALVEDGTVYVWGSNVYGQFGIRGYTATASAVPLAIPVYMTVDGQERTPEISAILAGGVTNFVLAKDGTVYAFGMNANGQCGRNAQSVPQEYLSGTNMTVPLAIDFYEPVDTIADEEGLYKDKLPVDVTRRAEVRITSLVGSVGLRTFIRDDEGNLWSFGNNQYGMTGCGNVISYCMLPVRASLYRMENYDAEYDEPNYLLKPAIVMGLVFAFAVFFFGRIEFLNRRKLRREAKEAAARAATSESAPKGT